MSGTTVTAVKTALRIRGLRKSFGSTHVLHGVDLEVTERDLIAVVGPSGCGKTTLLRCIAGFESIDGGSIEVAGQVLAEGSRSLPPEKRRIGIVPQEGALFPHLTVAGNVAFGLRDLSKDERRDRVEEMLHLVDMAAYASRRPDQLSGGQQQRVALARALAPAPALVLLDEPFAALDASLRAQVRQDVRRVLHEAGATAVLVTHDQEEALSAAEHVAVMRSGIVVQSDTPERVYTHPADADVATFLGDAVLLPGHRQGAVVTTILGNAVASDAVLGGLGTDPRVRAQGMVATRPEVIAVTRDPAGPGRVTEVEYFGHDAMVHVNLSGTMVRARVPGPQHLEIGDSVAVAVTGAVTFFPAATDQGTAGSN